MTAKVPDPSSGIHELVLPQLQSSSLPGWRVVRHAVVVTSMITLGIVALTLSDDLEANGDPGIAGWGELAQPRVNSIRSPTRGRLAAMLVARGDSIAVGQPIAVIDPIGSGTQAPLIIRAAEGGRVLHAVTSARGGRLTAAGERLAEISSAGLPITIRLTMAKSALQAFRPGDSVHVHAAIGTPFTIRGVLRATESAIMIPFGNDSIAAAPRTAPFVVEIASPLPPTYSLTGQIAIRLARVAPAPSGLRKLLSILRAKSKS